MWALALGLLYFLHGLPIDLVENDEEFFDRFAASARQEKGKLVVGANQKIFDNISNSWELNFLVI